MSTLQQYNTGQSTSSTVTTSGAVFGSVGTAAGSAQSLSSAINSGLQTGDIVSAMRSINLPAAGEPVSSIATATSMFSNSNDGTDFRVQLSLPTWLGFINSPILKPLKDAGGFVFPYTPTIRISSMASYGHESVMHNNFPITYFKNSAPQQITITGAMNVEDQTQALYWIASLHYLRSVTKMFMGYDILAGNPPPLVFLNGYGSYVFKNVPVVIESVDIELPNDCDYISTPVVGSALGSVVNAANAAITVSELLGFTNPIASAISQAASITAGLGLGGSTGAGIAYVPTKSQFSVTVRPVYSRTSARQFSLDLFVSGAYVNNYFGYV